MRTTPTQAEPARGSDPEASGTALRNGSNARIVQGIVILDLSGEITQKEAGAIVKVVEKFLGRDVLLNLRGVDYLDSTGIGELIAAAIKIMGGGGRIGVFNYNKVQPLFQKIITPPWYETSYKNERKAIAAFTSRN